MGFLYFLGDYIIKLSGFNKCLGLKIYRYHLILMGVPLTPSKSMGLDESNDVPPMFCLLFSPDISYVNWGESGERGKRD